jgi:F-type H+-transporting ATPase subunit alpha
MSVEKQVALLYCGTKGLLSKIPLDKVKEFEKEFLNILETMHKKDVLDPIKGGEINDEITGIIETTAKDITQRILQTTN